MIDILFGAQGKTAPDGFGTPTSLDESDDYHNAWCQGYMKLVNALYSADIDRHGEHFFCLVWFGFFFICCNGCLFLLKNWQTGFILSFFI